jgi:hypothetical protein
MVFFDRHNAAPFSTAGRFTFEALSLDSKSGRMQPEGIPPASNQEFYSRHHSVFRVIQSTPVDVARIPIAVESCRTTRAGPCPFISRHLVPRAPLQAPHGKIPAVLSDAIKHGKEDVHVGFSRNTACDHRGVNQNSTR